MNPDASVQLDVLLLLPNSELHTFHSFYCSVEETVSKLEAILCQSLFPCPWDLKLK